jgi:hypothetical protein
MAKRGVLRTVEGGGLMFACPGCGTSHMVRVGDSPGPHWRFNGNYDKPTIQPSILVSYTQWVPPATDAESARKILAGEIAQHPEKRVCHSFVTDGRIQFLSDCTHELAGQTVDLVPDDD